MQGLVPVLIQKKQNVRKKMKNLVLALMMKPRSVLRKMQGLMPLSLLKQLKDKKKKLNVPRKIRNSMTKSTTKLLTALRTILCREIIRLAQMIL